MSVFRKVALADLRLDPAFQQREEGLDPQHLAEMRDAGIRVILKKHPPVIFLDESGADGVYWMPGGFHRYELAVEDGLQEIPCEIRKGDWLDALVWSLGENADHGLRRTNADKRKAVLSALRVKRERRLNWSQSEIARMCLVTQQFVSKILSPGEESTTVVGDRDPPPEILPDLEQAEIEGEQRAVCARELTRARAPDPHRASREDVRNGLELLTRGLGGLGLLTEYRTMLAAVRARVWP